MSLVKFQPRSTQNNFPSLFDDFFTRELFNAKLPQENATNIIRSKDGITIEIATLGISKKDIEINLDGRLLKVSHKAIEQKKEEKTDWIKREFKPQSFERSFKLTDALDREKISAKSENGILSISIPFSEKEKAAKKKIAIA